MRQRYVQKYAQWQFLRLRESVTFLNFCSFLCKKGDTWCMMSWICHGGIFPLIFRWIWLMSTFIKIWRNWEFLRWPPFILYGVKYKMRDFNDSSGEYCLIFGCFSNLYFCWYKSKKNDLTPMNNSYKLKTLAKTRHF